MADLAEAARVPVHGASIPALRVADGISSPTTALQGDNLLLRARRAFDSNPSPTMADLVKVAGVSLRQLYRRFGSRDNLLRELALDAPPEARERILEAALELLGESGLADLSMDVLPARAGVSRAKVYRLFPGKPALFRELIARYSPWEPIARVLEEFPRAERTPAHVIPRVAMALSESLKGRSAVLLGMAFEMSRSDPDSAEGVQRSMQRGLPDLVRYERPKWPPEQCAQCHPCW